MPPKQSNKGSSSNKMPKKGGKMKPKTNGKGKAKKDERKKPNPFQRRVVVDKDTSKIHKSLFKKGKTAEEKELENMLFGSHFESDSIEYALGHVPEVCELVWLDTVYRRRQKTPQTSRLERRLVCQEVFVTVQMWRPRGRLFKTGLVLIWLKLLDNIATHQKVFFFPFNQW